MSATIMTAAVARRTGRDFVGILCGLPIEHLLPGKRHDQRLLDSLMRDALVKAGSQDLDDVAACACMHRFCKIVSALYFEGQLLSAAPAVVRGAFIESLEIAKDATDLEVPEVLQ